MAITIETNDLLSVAEAARILKKPKLTIYRWIGSSKITAVRFGGVLFVPRSEVERLIDVKGS
tara:strand:- start:298 stop:483 length:186 start_codon:yes stop_codon:yes gene_type:complete